MSFHPLSGKVLRTENVPDEFLYPELFEAHGKLDEAIESAYGVDFNGDENKIVSHLFNLYAEKVGE